MKHIAVVDDDPDMVRLVGRILADHFVVHTYTSGRQLLYYIAARIPDCVLLDIDLGDINGVIVLRSLRADARTTHIPVIALTAHTRESERGKYLAEGFDDYLAKPVDAEVLLATVQTALFGPCTPFVDDEASDLYDLLEGQEAPSR